MKVYQSQKDISLDLYLTLLLKDVRKKRNFNVDTYLGFKSKLIHQYFTKYNLKTAVVAMSGGVDSATVLGILNYTKQKYNSFDIVPITLPCHNNNGVTNQSDSMNKAIKQSEEFNLKCLTFDLEKISNDVIESYKNITNISPSDWAKGQLVPYLRTPLLYYLTTLYTDINKSAIIVGTTNRDEGAYLGYVGKASDYMVDLQVISDLHKSEVYKVAKKVGVIDTILKATPRGDMFENQSDTDIFGASYDFVELYLNVKDDIDLSQYDFAKNLENLHNYNKHKYCIGSPSYHLDIIESGVNNGWKLNFSNKYYDELKRIGNISKKEFVSPISFDNPNLRFIKDIESIPIKLHNVNEDILQGKLFNRNELIIMNGIFKKSKSFSFAGKDGYKSTGNSSIRKSLYSVELSEIIFNKLQNFPSIIEAIKPCTDWNKGEIYKFVGINPLFRFIDYVDDGILIPHYDYSFKHNDKVKSLYSIVIYLNDDEKGNTVFMEDEESWNKDLSDKDELFFDKSYLEIKPCKGNVLIFPHHLLHGSKQKSKKKTILRIDMMFEIL